MQHALHRNIMHLAGVLEGRIEVNLIENDAEFDGEVKVIGKVAVNLNFKCPIVHIVVRNRVCVIEERNDGISRDPEDSKDDDNVRVDNRLLNNRCLRSDSQETPEEHKIVSELHN